MRDLVITNSRPFEYDLFILKVDIYIWSAESLSRLHCPLFAFAGLFEFFGVFPPYIISFAGVAALYFEKPYVTKNFSTSLAGMTQDL